MVARGAGAAGPVLLACRQWDPLGLARWLPSLGVGAWRSAPLLPWRVQCPVRVCAALAAGSGSSGRYLVLCLSRFPPPAPRVPRCVWRAVPSGCLLPSLAGTPFHAVCAFRGLGPVALLVVPACPLRVCALALPRLPPPPVGGVACAPRAVPALGAGRAVPRGLSPSACPAPVPCSVWRAWGGAVRSRFPPTWLGVVRPPRGGSVAFVCRGAGWGGGGLCAVPPVCAAGGGSRAGGRSASFRPSAFPGQATKRVSWRRSGHGGRGPHTAPVRARPPSLGANCAASWRVGAGSLVPRDSCGSRRLGRGAGRAPAPLSGGGRGDHPPCLGGWGPAPPRLTGRWGGGGGGSGCGLPAPPLGGGPRFRTLAPLSSSAHSPPACAFGRGRGAAPGGGGGEGRPVDRSPGGPFRHEPSLCPPRVGNGHGGGHDGRSPHTVLVRRHVPPPGCGPVGRDPRGSRRLGALGRAVCRPSRIPPPTASRSLLGERGRPLSSGGAEGRSCGPQAGGGSGGGGGGGAAPPLPAPPPCRASACHPLTPARPPVGVAGRPWASGAARSAANGSVRRGGEGGGGNPPALVRAPAFPRLASEGAAPFAPFWAPLVRRRSAVGRAGACRRLTGGACRGRLPPHPGCSGLFGECAGPPSLRSASVRSWA